MAGLKVQRVTVDDVTYELTQLGAREGRRVLARLLSVAGPIVGELANIPSLAHGKKAGEKGEISEVVLARVIQKAAEALDPDTLDYVCDAMMGTCGIVAGGASVVKLSQGVFDLHFAGRYTHQMKWLWACLSFQFSDFLDALPRILPRDAAAGSQESTSPPT